MSKNKPEPPSASFFRSAIHLPLFFGGIGVLFLTIGVWLLVSNSPERELARGSALQLTTADTVRWRTVGETVLFEGNISADNRAGFRDFIAYQRDRYAGKDNDGPSKGVERWVQMERVTPPLSIDSAEGKVSIVNSRYSLRNPPRQWRSSVTERLLFGPDSERASGFVAGDLVVVEGTVTETAPASDGKRPRALEAVVLFGGNHAAYLTDLKSGIVAAKIIGVVFVGVGSLLGFIAWFLRVRLSKRGRVLSPGRLAGI